MTEPTNVSSPAPRSYGGFRVAVISAIVIIVLASAVSYGVASYVMSNRPVAVAEQYDEPQWLRDSIVQQHTEDFYSVYDCGDGSDKPAIPCPDYIATAELKGSAKDQPPVLQPARNAKGEIVIDLKPEWQPADCITASTGQKICLPDRWNINIVFAGGVTPFATNQFVRATGEWHGFKLFGSPSWGDDRLISPDSDTKFEVYAGDPDPAVKSARLPGDRIGV